ncbi:hypothetical protein, partial [Candidatus Synechococcus spongiarum]|uniref:hypothetical protein n=1 Tax=Candidatus Synechococcus spongiarum TaxID=431041 RepID=UPI001C590ADD
DGKVRHAAALQQRLHAAGQGSAPGLGELGRQAMLTVRLREPDGFASRSMRCLSHCLHHLMG